jgi:solute carrier family 30 (zinc transporter), member 9
MASGSKLAVGAAIAGNSAVMVAKFAVFGVTGSAAMLSEALHSLADTLNQVLLMVGIVRSSRDADRQFPFGYGAERAVWALMSAVGIFFLGAGVTVYHGINSLLHPHEIGGLGWAVGVLAVSFVVEGYVLTVAVKAVREEAAGKPFLPFLRTEADPTGVAVVLEDAAACVGILLAMGGIVGAHLTHNVLWDSLASILIGLLLAAVAIFLIARNRSLLVGPAIPADARAQVRQLLARHPAVEKIVHLRTRVLDPHTYRVAADLEFEGEYLAKKLEPRLREAWAAIETYEDFEAFAAQYADDVVEQLGDEVDAIEGEIRQLLPQARYLDIETE